MQQRNTRQRQLIFEAVRARHDHPGADQIFLDARALDEKISLGTVYRNLRRLAENGEILLVRVPDADRFDSRREWHYHLFWTRCGAVVDAPLPYRADIDQALQAQTGYAIARHRIVFEGLCPACREGKKPR